VTPFHFRLLEANQPKPSRRPKAPFERSPPRPEHVALRAYKPATQERYAQALREIAERTDWAIDEFLPLTSLDTAMALFCLLDGCTANALHGYTQAIVCAHATAGIPPPPFQSHEWKTFWAGLLKGAGEEESHPIHPMPPHVSDAVLHFWLDHPSDAAQRNGTIAIMLHVTAVRYQEIAKSRRAHFLDCGPGHGVKWTLPARQSKNTDRTASVIIPESDGQWRPADIVRRFLAIAPEGPGLIFRATRKGPARWGPDSDHPHKPALKGGAFNEALNRALDIVLPRLVPPSDITHFTSHSFRKGRAVHQFESGASVEDVQALLRHRSDSAILSYVPAAKAALAARRKRPRGTSIWTLHKNKR
jgi:integrase